MGKKLTTYEMDADTDSSFISGQPKILDRLEKEEVTKILILLSQINEFGFNEKIVGDIELNQINLWGKQDFQNIINKIKDNLSHMEDKEISFIDELNNNTERKIKKKQLIEENIKIIQNIIMPANRFKSVTSTMFNSLRNGDLVLIDNIQLASPQIIELISSLCGKFPVVDLLEKGEDFYYSREECAKNKIHKDFRLFITIDPSYSINSNIIDQSLRPKCISFNLPPLDSKPEYSAQIFHSSLKNSMKKSTYNDIIIDKSKIYSSLAPKLANVHSYVLEKSKLNIDDFSGGCQMTARKITNFCKEFYDNSNSLKEQISDGLRAIYYNTYINHETNEEGKEEKFINFKNDIIKEFQKDSKLLLDDINVEDKYEDLLNILRDIQLVCEGKKNHLKFNFEKFTNYCLNIKICDLGIVMAHIKDTLDNYIIKSSKINEEKKLEFGQIKIILRIFEEIISNRSFLLGQELELQLDDSILLKNEKIIYSIFKLNLLANILTKDELYFYQKYNYIIDYISIFKKINKNLQKLKKEENVKSFAEFLLEFKKDPNIYENIFPNAIFKDTKISFINYLIPLIIKIIKVNSFILIKFPNDISIKFGKISKSGLYTEVYIENDNLLFSIGSKILCGNKKMKEELRGAKEEDVFSFYRLIEKFYDQKDITRKMIDEYKKEILISSNKKYLIDDYFNLAHFFRNSNENTLIGSAINLCYNRNKEFIGMIEPYLLICERDILKFIKILFYELIPNIDYTNYNDNLDKLTRYIKSFSSFCQKNSYLWKIINDKLEISSEENISKIKEELKIEKSDLKKIINVEKEIFDMSIYEEILKKEEDNIALMENQIESDLEQKELKIKFEKLISILRNKIFKDISLNSFSEGLITEIQYIIKKKMTAEIYEKKKNEVEILISDDNRIEQNKSGNNEANKSFISWPEYISNISSNVVDNEIKLIEHIIWYSYYYSIFDSIPKDLDDPIKEREIIRQIMKNNDETMKNLSNYLISVRAIGGKIVEEIDVMISTLISEFIRRIEKDNLLLEIFELHKKINKYIDRYKKSENFYSWLNSISSKYNSDFKLYLPKFTKTDIFYLYLQCNRCQKDNEEFSIPIIIYKPGISLSDLSIRSIFFGYLRNDLKLKDIQNNKDCIDNIAKIIYNKLFDKKNDPYLNEHSIIMEKFNEKKEEIEKYIIELNGKDKKKLSKEEIIILEKNKKEAYEKKNLIIRILNSLDLAPKIDNCIDAFELEYPDKIDFKNWEKEEDFLGKNPSILFWLSKYNNYAQNFPDFKSDKYSIDFWFFCFRIFSSYNCIKCDIPIQKYADFINQFVVKHFENKSKNNYNFGKDWVSLMLKNPEKIENKEINDIYKFLYELLSDKKEYKKDIEKEREICLKSIIESLYTKLFGNQLHEFIQGRNIDDSDNKTLINFFINPNHFIYKNIEDKFKYNLTKINNKSKDLNQVYESFKSIIPNKIEEIKNVGENEIKNQQNLYIKEEERKKNNQLDENIKKTNINKNVYQDSIEKFIKSENLDQYKLDPNEIETLFKDLKNLKTDKGRIENEIQLLKEKFDQNKGENNDEELQKLENQLQKNLNDFKQKKELLKQYCDKQNISDFSNECYNNVCKNKENVMNDLLDKNNPYAIIKMIEINDSPIGKYFLVKQFNNKSSITIIKNGMTLYVDKNSTFQIYNKESYEEESITKQIKEIQFPSINKEFDIEKYFQEEIKKPVDTMKSRTLIFGENNIQINDFIKKLNNYSSKITNLTEVQKMIKELSENYDLRKSKQYNMEVIKKLEEISSENKDILKLLSCKFSGNGGECKNVQNLLEQFKLPLQQFIDKITIYDEEIQNISDLWNSLNELNSEKELFSNDYSFPEIINQTNKPFSFIGIQPDCEHLSLPLVTLDGNKLICNPEKIVYHFGNLCPYLYKEKIKFNILCFINPNLKVSIESDNEDVACFPNLNNSLLKLCISIPKLENEENQESKKIIGKILFKSENGGFEEKELPFEFEINLIPLIIYFSNSKYKLLRNKNNNEYQLKVNKLFSGENIRFDIKYYHLAQSPIFDVTLHHNNDNEVEKPEIKKNLSDGYFTLKIQEEKNINIKKLSCYLFVYFKGSFKIKIFIEAIIIPANFSFSVYDFFEKKLQNSSTIYLNKDHLPIEIPIILRIEKPYQEKIKGNLYFYPNSNENIKFKILNNINLEDINIEEYLKINLLISSFKIDSKETIKIHLNINNYNQYVKIIFEYKKDCEEINDFKKFKTYQKIDGEWKEIEYDKLDPLKFTYTMLGPSNYYKENNLRFCTFYYQKKLNKYFNNVKYEKIQNSSIIKVKFLDNNINNIEKAIYRPIFGIYNNNGKKKLFAYPYVYEYNKKIYLKTEKHEYIKDKLSNLEEDYNKNNKAIKEVGHLFNIFERGCYDLFTEFISKNFNDFEGINEISNIAKEIKEINNNNYFKVKYKIILEFFDMCNKSIEEYEQNNQFLSFHNYDYEIQKHIAKEIYCLPDYSKFDKNEFEENIIILRDKIEKSLLNMEKENDDIEQMEESDAFKISEISSDKAKRNEDLNILQNTYDIINVSTNRKFEISIPDLNIDNINSINDIINLLNSSIPIIRILPIFLRNSFKFNEVNNQEFGNKIFLKLYSIYMSVYNHENCLIKNQILEFIQSFKLLIIILKQAHANFGSILPEDFDFNVNSNNQSFIDFPEIQIGFDIQKAAKWEKREMVNDISESSSNTILVLKSGLLLGHEDQLQKAKYRKINTLTNYTNQDDNSFDSQSLDLKNEEEKKQNEKENERKEKEIKRKELEKREIEKENERIMNELNKYTSLNAQDEEVEEEQLINTNSEKTNNDNESTINDEYFNNQITPPSKAQMKELIENFKEEDAFKIIMDKLLSFKNAYPPLDLGENFKGYNITHIDDKTNVKDFPVKDLLKLSYDIAAYLISISTLETVPFNEICVNILFDVSFFISDENKLFNMFLVCCAITALSCMEIPYSLTLISDENFKCTIKRFSDVHSLENMQKIFDCIFVRRFYTNLANNTKYAINNLYFQQPEERPYRAFITFSNGLDERLFMADSWEEKVFKSCSDPSKNKFGYVFLKGELLNDDNLITMEGIWENFERENNKRVKLTIINYSDKYEQLNLNKIEDPKNLISKFGEMFSFVLQFHSANIPEKNNYNINLPLFKLDALDNLDNIFSLKQRDFSHNSGIYTNNTEILLEAKNISLPLNSKYYKNYFDKIVKTDLKTDSDSNLGQNLKELIVYMKENKQKLGPAAIETVFKCNYATQKVLSTQGSEFDITALLFHLINPSPNPRIYLQKKIMIKEDIILQ